MTSLNLSIDVYKAQKSQDCEMASVSRKFTSTHIKHRCRSRPYPPRSVKTRSQSKSSQGFFEKLPAEVFDLILDHLSALDASVFSMVSKTIGSYVVRHVSTSSWRKRMIFQWFCCVAPNTKGSALDHFRCLGLLFKRCSLLLPTKKRLRLACKAFSQVLSLEMEQCAALHSCQGFTYYGMFLKTLIAGWDELECHRVFKCLSDTTNLQQHIKIAVTCKPGACHRLELVIRLFCRGVFLDQCQSVRDSFFWLMCLLRPWPIVSQARILFIIFGPLQPDGKIGWEDVCEHVVGQGGLCELAKAIILLHGHEDTKDWRADTVLSIIDEMMVTPLPWHMENMARLLILCGTSICYSVLASKLINGRLTEISRLLMFLILVTEKDGYRMNWAVKMTQQVYKLLSVTSEKWSFIQTVENMFSEVTLDLYEHILRGNHNGDTDMMQNLCHLLNACAHFHAEIIFMSFSKD